MQKKNKKKQKTLQKMKLDFKRKYKKCQPGGITN